MTTDFTDYVSQQDAKNTIHLNIIKYSMMLCDALQQDFQKRNHGATGLPYNYTWALDSSGRKYHKIFMYINGKRDSIHCFIDKKTGSVYKPASLKSPAKGVRYDLRLIKDREWLFENADWSGSYLYQR